MLTGMRCPRQTEQVFLCPASSTGTQFHMTIKHRLGIKRSWSGKARDQNKRIVTHFEGQQREQSSSPPPSSRSPEAKITWKRCPRRIAATAFPLRLSALKRAAKEAFFLFVFLSLLEDFAVSGLHTCVALKFRAGASNPRTRKGWHAAVSSFSPFAGRACAGRGRATESIGCEQTSVLD